MFDEIVIGIGHNQSKRTHFSIEKRIEMIRKAFETNPE